MIFKNYFFGVLTVMCLFSVITFVSCGDSDEEEVVDCYTDHIDPATLTAYSAALEAYTADFTNKALCEEFEAALTSLLDEYIGYSNCIKDNGVAATAGFENIDEQIAGFEMARDQADCN